MLGRIKAKEIWDKDTKRKADLESHGYTVLTKWEDQDDSIFYKEFDNVILKLKDKLV